MLDGRILGALTALNICGIVLVDIVTGTVPEILAFSLTALVGATAGVSYVKRKTDAADTSSSELG